ncbi:MAG: hypothetical protein K6G62_08125 [Eubacterium sp.]|nr:hypothetical protein [Eubacterium sp.]
MSELLGKSIGFVVGLMITAVLVVVIIKFANKDKAFKTKYDERQLAARGKAYAFGFWTLMLCNIVFIYLDVADFDLNFLGNLKFFIPIFLGVLVQVSYSIWNDCYMGLNSNSKRFTIIFLVMGIAYFIFGIREIIQNGMVENGLASQSLTTLFASIFILLIVVQILIKGALDKREED